MRLAWHQSSCDTCGKCLATLFPPRPPLSRQDFGQAHPPLGKYRPPSWGRCPLVLQVWTGLSYWWRSPAVWRECWSRRYRHPGRRGSRRAWWSAWQGRLPPSGTGCWCCCCCCWARQQRSRSGIGRRPPAPPTQRLSSSVSMFSLSLFGPACVETRYKELFCKIIKPFMLYA